MGLDLIFSQNYLLSLYKKTYEMANHAPSNEGGDGNDPNTPILFNSPGSHPNPTDAFEQSLINLQLDEARDADGGDSDIEGEESEIFDESSARTALERDQFDNGFHVKEVSSGDIGFILCKRQGQFDDGNEDDLLNSLPKAPDDWRPPEKKQVMIKFGRCICKRNSCSRQFCLQT